MADEVPPISNPFAATAPYFKSPTDTPSSGEKGIKTVSTLFIVFGILGLLTLPSMLLGAAMQIFMPQFNAIEASAESTDSTDSTSSPDSNVPEPASDAKTLKQPSDSEVDSPSADVPRKVSAEKKIELQMQEFQEFNVWGFLLGLVNVLLSGFLLWSGLGLSQKKLSAARMGIAVCNACIVFEVVRVLFGAWINFQLFKAFSGIASSEINEEIPVGMIMAATMALGFLFTLLYAVGKCVMYVLCARHLNKPHVQALLIG